MTEKRFVDYFDKDHNYIIQDLQNEDEYQVGFVNCDEDIFLELVNKIAEENEQLKQQLLYDGEDVCGICKHEYLTPSGDYFIGKCKKGHEECSKEDVKYCEDFEKR